MLLAELSLVVLGLAGLALVVLGLVLVVAAPVPVLPPEPVLLR